MRNNHFRTIIFKAKVPSFSAPPNKERLILTLQLRKTEMAGAGWSNQEKRDGNLGRKILSIGKLPHSIVGYNRGHRRPASRDRLKRT